MVGLIEAALKLVHRGIDLFVNEDQLPEIRNRREGDRLEKAFRQAHREWRRSPTPENKKVRDEALAALNRWSDRP